MMWLERIKLFFSRSKAEAELEPSKGKRGGMAKVAKWAIAFGVMGAASALAALPLTMVGPIRNMTWQETPVG